MKGKIDANCKATDSYVRRHVRDNHFCEKKEEDDLAELAAIAVAIDGKPLNSFCTPSMAAFCKRANKAIPNGISEYLISKNIR